MSLLAVWREIMSGIFEKCPEKIEEKKMLNGLKELFKKDIALIQTCKLSAMLVNILNELTIDTLKDGNAKDAAIDCIIQVLQQEKSQPQIPSPKSGV